MVTRFKLIRIAKEIKLKDLSKATGISWKRISALERGEIKPKLHEVVILARALQVDPFEFTKIPKRKGRNSG